ncbi:MAG: hypothetical protein GY899_07975 [Verrucomicrobiaceae bacterium]|nr:hypothetical protein [Verrucomicrobiaceae bacterium]
MKTKLSLLGIIASLSAVVTVSAQNTAVTKPVGYHTETVLGDAFTLLGINVSGPVAAAGDFDADSAQDDDVDFTTLLTAGTPYTVQNLATGAAASVTGFNANTLTTTLAVSDGDTYEIRQDSTVASIFGANNEAGLGEGDENSADTIWVPQTDGSFIQIYRSTGGLFGDAGWRQIGDAQTDQSGQVIAFTSSIFIQRKQADPLDIVFVGHVRTSATTYGLLAGQFNFVNRVLPVGITLADTNIEAAIAAGTWADGDADTADMIWVTNGAGGYDQFYFSEGGIFGDAQWTKRGGDGTDQAGQELTSGFAIQKRSANSSVTIALPGDLDI